MDERISATQATIIFNQMAENLNYTLSLLDRYRDNFSFTQRDLGAFQDKEGADSRGYWAKTLAKIMLQNNIDVIRFNGVAQIYEAFFRWLITGEFDDEFIDRAKSDLQEQCSTYLCLHGSYDALKARIETDVIKCPEMLYVHGAGYSLATMLKTVQYVPIETVKEQTEYWRKNLPQLRDYALMFE